MQYQRYWAESDRLAFGPTPKGERIPNLRIHATERNAGSVDYQQTRLCHHVIQELIHSDCILHTKVTPWEVPSAILLKAPKASNYCNAYQSLLQIQRVLQL